MLYVFGDSLSTAIDLTEEQGWPYKLAKKLGVEYANYAGIAADNFYIYSSYLSVRNKITPDDVVVVGWSHPSRKTFVFDKKNSNHRDVINSGLQYQVGKHTLFRSNNPDNDTAHQWHTLSPTSSGNNFFDCWFDNYYSEFEQSCHLQSYCDSVASTCVGKYVPFFFSDASIKGIDVHGIGSALEFITKHHVYISESNVHFNEQGHTMWAELIYKNL